MNNKPLISSSSPINRDSLKQKRPKLGNFILLLVSILFSLFVAEIATRVLFPDRIVLFPRNVTTAYYDGATLRRLIPNTTFWHTSIDGSWEFRTNTQGFRDDEDYQNIVIELDKRPDELSHQVAGAMKRNRPNVSP